MKTCFRFAFLTAFLLWMCCRPAVAQPVVNGYAAATCYSLDNSGTYNGPVLGIMDVRLANLQPFNTNWMPPYVSHGPASAPWNHTNLGEVFGVTFDPAGNIYVSATIVYGNTTPGGPGGSGAIYKVSGVTGSISTFATLPNSGNVGLGNLTWDPANNQMFATNFEDGKIYRISSTGTVLGSFDPFGPDGGTAGLSPVGERLWGIGVWNSRVYFGRWVENTGNPAAGAANEVWSVALVGGNFSGSEVLEISVPAFPTQNYSNPVSDISFSGVGRMMLSERGQYESGGLLYPAAHSARMLEYINTGTWTASPNIFIISELGTGGMTGSSSAGGNDYAYDSYDQAADQLVGCDEAVWSSGDALDFYTPNVIYGFQRLPATGGDVTNSVLIDADGNLVNQDKNQIGDIEIYKHCDVVNPDPCRGIDVKANPSPNGEGCCYDLTINGLTAGAFTSISATAVSPGTTFTGVIGPGGWSVTNTGTVATWTMGGTIPGGTVTGLHFCISTTAPAPQTIEVVLHAKDGTECRFTVHVDCQPHDPMPCFVVNDFQIQCKEHGPKGWVYSFSFTVTNYSPFSQAPYFLPAENLSVYAPGMTITPALTALSPTLPYGATSGTLNYTLTSPTIMPGDHICIFAQLFGKKLQYDYQWCCLPDSVCFDLPQCRECCDSVDFTIDHNYGKQSGNTGASIGSTNVTVTPGPITKVQADIIGVNRSRVWCPNPQTGVYAPVANESSILGVITGGSISPVMPVAAGFVPPTSEVIWGTVASGVNFSGGSIGMNLSFPGTSLGWRCLDTLTICVRYTFTDTACRTCDTVVCYKVPRCGNIDIAPSDPGGPVIISHADPVLGTGITIGEPLYSDVITGPGLALSMSSLTRGDLAISHWWQDNIVGVEKVRLVKVFVMPEPGIDITTLTPLDGGQGAEILDHTATASMDLNPHETDHFDVRFSNPNNTSFFAMHVQFEYVNTDEPDIHLISRDYVVYGDLNGSTGGPQGEIHVAENGKSKVALYKLLISANSESANWLSPSCFRFTPPQGVRILASGPMPDSSTAEFHVLQPMSKITPLLLQLPSPGEYRKDYIQQEKTAELWLVLEGEGNLFDLNWEALNMNNETVGNGSVSLSATSTVKDGDHYVPGTTINLLDAYPNPTEGNVTTRFNLAHTEQVTVTVVDVTGREVVRLVDNERLSAGEHEYGLNLKSLAQGSYYIRLTTESGTQTRSVVRK